MADAEVGGVVARRVAESMVAIQMTGRGVAEVALPAALADASVWVIDAAPVETSGHGFAGIAVVTGPPVVADAFVGIDTLAVGAVVAAWNVAVGSLPTVLAVALEGVRAATVIASRQRDTDVAVGALPSDLTGAKVGGSAFAMDAPVAIVVAHRLQARVQGGLLILEVWLPPPGLADDVPLTVADIPRGVFQVFRLAGVVVDVERGEPHGVAGEAEEKNRKNHRRKTFARKHF